MLQALILVTAIYMYLGALIFKYIYQLKGTQPCLKSSESYILISYFHEKFFLKNYFKSME